jgi:two-component system OmpR family sensor kinase
MAIRTRIALYGAGVVFLAVVIFSVLVYLLVNRSVLQQQDAAILRRSQQFLGGDSAQFGGRGPRELIVADLRHSSDTFIELLADDGTILYSTGAIDGHPPSVAGNLLRQVDLTGPVLTTVEPSKGVFLRESVRKVAVTTSSGGSATAYMVAGQPMGPIEDNLNALRGYLIVGALLALVGALAATWLVAGRALRPVDLMADTAEEIGRTRDLSRRLPDINSKDEVSRLSGSFNSMLAELQDAYHRLESTLATQQRFVADASHELRTPLTTIRSNVGLLLGGKRLTEVDRGDALRDIEEESERMSRLVQELLTLARADAGQHLELVPVNVAGIASDVCRQARRLHPEREIELRDGKSMAPVEGNADALKQLLWILVDNAVRHTPEKSAVKISVDQGAGAVELSVDDEGPGIPLADREQIFERFYQADPARTGEGTGLGLAIARWIAREHRGSVEAGESSQGGASFRVRLPLAPV